MRIIATILFVGISTMLMAQSMTDIRTRWSDDFREWIILSDEDGFEGTLRMQWLNRNDWSSWEYEYGEEWGNIRRKWSDDPNMWELRNQGKLIEIQTRWRNDFTEWRIKESNKTYFFHSKWRNIATEWELKGKENGQYIVYAEWEDDPRDWLIIDDTDEEISFGVKMAMNFIAIFHSIPKN